MTEINIISQENIIWFRGSCKIILTPKESHYSKKFENPCVWLQVCQFYQQPNSPHRCTRLIHLKSSRNCRKPKDDHIIVVNDMQQWQHQHSNNAMGLDVIIFVVENQKLIFISKSFKFIRNLVKKTVKSVIFFKLIFTHLQIQVKAIPKMCTQHTHNLFIIQCSTSINASSENNGCYYTTQPGFNV